MLAPSGILGEPFYKIFQNFGTCGHIKGTLLQNSQNSQNSRRVGRVVSVEKYKKLCYAVPISGLIYAIRSFSLRKIVLA